MLTQRWLRSYAALALRIDRHLGGTALIYDGPQELRRRLLTEPVLPTGLV